ncbi:SDR family oxidoreductase [Corynebacterium pacaense]|uniref:SDR family oxidoreductase n=1 Tax=Corynebacterium pacaense TaxID=1816684 RepID=UPI0009B98DEF|nr:SDR family oxidoreductase [Corynebacterium pacaense]
MNTRTAPTLNYHATHASRRALVTGATGYVGGRLITELLAAGFTVRATSRHRGSLMRFDWHGDVELVEADLSSPDDLAELFADVDVVFYLVHSMGGRGEDFEEVEKKTAGNVAEASARAGVSQMVYLSGLHPGGRRLEDLSKHMRSREQVARILLDSPTPALILRAATLIGSGSASFEIIRHLTERLPVMTAPQWINNSIEPLAIRDALHYLVNAADLGGPVNRAFDIGCGTSYAFADLLRIYASIRGLKRRISAVPLNLPMDTLSGWWISLVTPVPFSLAFPLAQSMAEDAVTEEHDIAGIIPDPPDGFIDYPTAVRLALEAEHGRGVPTSWDRSWTTPAPVKAWASQPTDPDWSGRDIYSDVRESHSDLPAERIWPVIEGLGGPNGWYSAPRLWKLRGIADRLIGGPGLGGRRDPVHLALGDRIDWWRVTELDPPHRLVLTAEMRVDGNAWLVLEVTDDGHGGSVYRQSALFEPTGLAGRAYWWAVKPFHAVIFPYMARNILGAAS